MLPIPLRSDSPLRHTPWMNWGLIVVNIAMFLGQRIWPPLADPLVLDARDPRVVQYIGYAFLHAGWLHLLANMLALYIFGNNVNDRLGHLGYLAFYLSGAVFAGIGFVLAPGSHGVWGASGAVGAVMGAYLALLPRSNITLLAFITVGEVPSMYFIAFYFIFNVVMSFAGQSEVAYITHIAGMLLGFLVGLGLLAAGLVPRESVDILSLLGRWNRRRQYRALVAQGYDPFNPAPPPDPEQRTSLPPAVQQAITDLRAAVNEALAQHRLPDAADLFLKLRKLDPEQVLARQAQLDVANQLASQQHYSEAAQAYEQFLKHYPNFGQIEQVELMLGLVYARYLNQPDRARQCLRDALKRLHTEREVELAKAELAQLPPEPPAT